MTRTRWTAPAGAWIITPAVAGERFAKARSCGATVTLVDLEDSVAPHDKDLARERAADFFATADPAGPLPGVRMNALTTRAGLRDLVALADYRPPLVLVPMVESARDIEVAAAALDANGYAPQIWALIETPRAIETAPSILASPRLTGVLFGAADYAAITGAGRTWQALLHARSVLANAAAAAGIAAVDSPYFDLTDTDGLRREAEQARALGYTGKTAVHPRQVPTITEAFRPTDAELAQARAIVAAHGQTGASITSVHGQMVGAPFYAAAQALTERADHQQSI
ncbi:CoA ester lyase [Kitasatospora sp. GP82]|uniref:HpcH/HpaI aldolase/citrate lyase family protein n=1 Tax=Kitasatospora sp. GP82 TaxID=3035089 RepID=UPI002476BDF7|nr:CoA ester lyase [Kitasatospora sp. GP82]MDH6130252.1 citrate lyase beta subunit [Kitasatospora sp. GP82]